MLLALKLHHTAAVIPNWGKHESFCTTSFDGFGYEIRERMGLPVYTELLQLFKSLPVVCFVEYESTKLLIVYGGILAVDSTPL